MKQSIVSNWKWRRSTSCNAGNCVEVAAIDGGVALRDSKNRDGAILTYSRSEWEAFVTGIRSGDFDDLV